jgi:hypothetical protein
LRYTKIYLDCIEKRRPDRRGVERERERTRGDQIGGIENCKDVGG